MCDFKVGDEVVRVGLPDSARMPWQLGQPDLGLVEDDRVYVVASLHADPRFHPIIGVQLVGVECPSRHGWDHRGFRKVQRRDLTAWLQTAAPVDPELPSPPKPVKPREKEAA